MLLGSIEAGGTKFVCAIGNEHFQILDHISIPTTTPKETFNKAIDYFKQFNELNAMSIASFGPIELRPNSSKYGYITDTPKAGWSNVNFLGKFKEAFNIPIYWTTDVNGSAYGEYVLAEYSHNPVHSLVYYTIGTGVGAGSVINGHFLGGVGHPEIGHSNVKRHPDDKDFHGICPYHGDCLEGLVSGPTFEARLGKKGKDVPLNNHVWDIMAYYVAQSAIQTTLTIRPETIVFGGGVVSSRFLNKIRKQFRILLNNYIHVGNLRNYIRMPIADDNSSATLGNFALAIEELKNSNESE